MEQNNSSAQSIRENRIQKLTDLIDMGTNPYPYTFDKTANTPTLQEKYKDLEPAFAMDDIITPIRIHAEVTFGN